MLTLAFFSLTESLKDSDVDWKSLSFCKDSSVAEHQLQLIHLKRRLSVDMKSKDFLGLYCKISTVARVFQYRLNQTVLPDVVLVSGEMVFHETSGSLDIEFLHKKMSSVLYYTGESAVEVPSSLTLSALSDLIFF